MFNFEQTFAVKSNGKTDDKNIIICGNIRISVITDRLIRIENQYDEKFCDMPTQTVLNRDFDSPEYSIDKAKKSITVTTQTTSFRVALPSGNLDYVMVERRVKTTDFYSCNLKGTRRTLDFTFGKVGIEDGIISRTGVALIDDSNSLLLCPDGLVKPRKDVLGRKENGRDIYCFAYGHDYNAAVADYYKLTGSTPLIPRYALGNWWSRYKAYTQEEYLKLMKRFTDEKIPITVATIDMDWHWVKVKEKFGEDATEYKMPKSLLTRVKGCYINPGWTGYSWNTDLFPDYKEFLKQLHDENLTVTVNVHPAVGVRYFEDMYKEFASYMGMNPDEKKQIEFDITDRKFIEGYFEFIHHKYEQDGVDFWWLDWQQEKFTKVEGLDPLWALNHYHSLDSQRDNKRPIILSRFAGNGSHRYPLGFSGDTISNWSVLKFQPYFTLTASNIGYSWWSHDIGGHQLGKRDDELYVRWIQFGAFSPILRMHSSLNEFLGKEPWKFSHEAESAAKEMLRFRHRMIPYIYSANRRTQKDRVPLMKPMYYDYPEDKEAYEVQNEYKFGSELIVSPITEKTSAKTHMAAADIWLPNGRYTDIFTGITYKGGKKFKMYRDTWSIPVLAGEGSIIPLSENGETNDWKNPDKLEVLIYRGNGKFSMYEDDGKTRNFENGEFSETLFEVSENGNSVKFKINASQGDTSVLPEKRDYILSFRDIACGDVLVECNKEKIDFEKSAENGFISISIKGIKPNENVDICFSNYEPKKNPEKKELMAAFLSKIQESNTIKVFRFSKCLEDGFDGKIVAGKDIRGPIEEIMQME